MFLLFTINCIQKLIIVDLSNTIISDHSKWGFFTKNMLKFQKNVLEIQNQTFDKLFNDENSNFSILSIKNTDGLQS